MILHALYTLHVGKGYRPFPLNAGLDEARRYWPISKTTSPPDMMSAWEMVLSTGFPLRATSVSDIFALERFFATTEMVRPPGSAIVAFGICGAPMTYSPPQGLNG